MVEYRVSFERNTHLGTTAIKKFQDLSITCRLVIIHLDKISSALQFVGYLEIH